jgi:hypothetical protein
MDSLHARSLLVCGSREKESAAARSRLELDVALINIALFAPVLLFAYVSKAGVLFAADLFTY